MRLPTKDEALAMFLGSGAILMAAVSWNLVSPRFASAQAVPVAQVAQVAQAQPAQLLTATRSVEFTCPAAAGITDMDTDVAVRVECGNGFRAISMETEETTTDTYICGGTGCTKANFTTVGKRRKVGAPNGASFGGGFKQFDFDLQKHNIKCIADGPAVSWRLLCAQ